MTISTLGLIAGLLLAIATIAGGITGFLLALVFGAVGYLAGGQVSGDIDLGALISKRTGG